MAVDLRHTPDQGDLRVALSSASASNHTDVIYEQAFACQNKRSAADQSFDVSADAIEGFWRRVERPGLDDCWHWMGARTPAGYGMFTWKEKGRTRGTPAIRAAYRLAVGAIPDGLVLDHLCRVRHCVNPRHLEPVTQAENNRRMWAFQEQRHEMGRDCERKACVTCFIKGRRPHPQLGKSVADNLCPRGHFMLGDNLRIQSSNGSRACVQCNTERCQAWREERKAAGPITVQCVDGDHHLCRPDRDPCSCPCHAVEAAA